MTEDHSMLIEFIRTHAHEGAHWLAQESGHKYSKIVNLAHRHRISLKPKGDNRGRKLKDNVMPRNRVTHLDSDHPIVIAVWEKRVYEGKRVLGTSQWKKQRERVLVRDNYTCLYCGQPATEVDHVIPRKKGGGHDMENLVACCKRCNGLKGSRSQAAFLEVLSTPPVFPDFLSPTQSKIHQDSPFTAKPVQN
jgi:5-methylcytosine-specific restriction endonuclease McrA